jgi:hypothetical protein
MIPSTSLYYTGIIFQETCCFEVQHILAHQCGLEARQASCPGHGTEDPVQIKQMAHFMRFYVPRSVPPDSYIC